MNDPRCTGRKVLVGFLLTLAASAPAFADSYVVGLFESGTGTGSGSFEFTNNGSSGTASVALATNASSSIGAQTFNSAILNVQVAAVNFNDGKTDAPAGANQITGNYVEGLTGSMQTTPATDLRTTGQCNQQSCFYRITFAFSANLNPNNAGVKTYQIQLIRESTNNVVETPVTAGTYSVNNTATIPEPGSLVLIGIGFAALAWSAMRRRPRGAAA